MQKKLRLRGSPQRRHNPKGLAQLCVALHHLHPHTPLPRFLNTLQVQEVAAPSLLVNSDYEENVTHAYQLQADFWPMQSRSE